MLIKRRKLIKEEIIKLTLALQDNFSEDLKSIKRDLSEFTENFHKLEAELVVTKQVNNVLRNHLVQVERKSWNNEQYSRRECLEIVVIPETMTNS